LRKACEIARAAEQTTAAINNGQLSDVQAVYHQRTNKTEQKQTVCGKSGKTHNFEECGKQYHTCKGNNQGCEFNAFACFFCYIIKENGFGQNLNCVTYN